MRLSLRCLAAALLVLTPSVVHAQNSCTTAVPILLNDTLPFTTVGMTASPETWTFGCGTGTRPDMWFSFVAPADGTYLASTCGSDDSALELFAGPCGALTRIDCDNGRCRAESSFQRGGKVHFRASAGEQIFARVGTWLAGSSSSSGSLSVTQTAAPAGDDCGSPIAIANGDSIPVDLFPATLDGPVPACGPGYGGDLWFEFMPTESGTYEATACFPDGLNFVSTAVACYTGSCGSLALEGCSSGNCSAVAGSVHSFAAVVGQRYLLRVMGTFWISDGNFTLNRVGGSADDECATAPDLTSGVFDAYDLSGSTPSNQPWSCATGIAGDIWRRFVVPSAGTYNAYATRFGASTSERLSLQVLRGDCFTGQELACDAGTSWNDNPSVVVQANAGEILWIRVGGNATSGVNGNVRVVPGPSNDDCENALAISPGSWTSFQTGDANPSPLPWTCITSFFDEDVWFRVVPTTSGQHQVIVKDEFERLRDIEVFEGDCANPMLVGCASAGSSPFQRAVMFQATAQTSYLIRVNDWNYDVAGQILVHDGVAPDEDECVQAAALVPGENPFDLSFATQSTDPGPMCGSGGPPPSDPKDVWFYFDPTEDARASFHTCSEDVAAMTLYQGTDCGTKIPLLCSRTDPSGLCGSAFSSDGVLLLADLQAGVRTYLRIHGDEGGPDVLTFLAEPLGPVGTSYCPGVPNSTGLGATLMGSGSPRVIVNDLVLEAEALPAASICMFVVGSAPSLVVQPGGSLGNLCLGGSLGRYDRTGEIQASDSLGAASLPIGTGPFSLVPNNGVRVLPGDTWHYQVWYRDVVGGVSASNFTSALSIQFE